MDKDKKVGIRRPDVLRKLNAESLQLIERGLLGDLPERLKPVPVRGNSDELVVAKPSGFLSSCLPVIPDTPTPTSEKIPSDDEVSPLKKTFSFRDKIRIGLFGKDKMEKTKWKTIEEGKSTHETAPPPLPPSMEENGTSDHAHKSSKRFWFFRNKELTEKREKSHKPIYKRSKSFEFLPRALEEDEGNKLRPKLTKNTLSYAYGSSDTLDETTSVDSLEYLADVYYDKAQNIYLKSIKEIQDLDHHSIKSTSTSVSSGLILNVLKTESVQDLLDEFDKAVDMFSENYMSDCEPYTKTTKDLPVKEKRKSNSFVSLPSPKVLQVAKVNEVSENFKAELSKILQVKRGSLSPNSARRGSVTDCFLLEEKNRPLSLVQTTVTSEANKYRRAQKKPIQRVRRISSTKYVST